MSDNSAYTGKDPDPERIWTRQDFGRELTLVKDRAGLTVRQVARAAGLPPSTAGDYFAGRHLPGPGNPGLLARILNACGETEPARLAQWTNALIRARRQPGKRALGAGAPYRGLASFEPADARWFFGREDVTERLVELDERLITVDADTVRIAHDALLTAWPRLRSWIDSGLEDARTRRRSAEAARIREETGRDSSASR
jgi:transcriptional regulator with XRE-family HTH domain